MLKLIEDLSGFDLVDLYVEYEVDNPEIIDEAEAVRGFDVDDDVEVDNDKDDNIVVNDDVKVNNDKEDNIVVGDDVEVNNDKEDNVVVDDDVEVNNDKEDNAIVDDDVEVSNDKEDNDDTNADYVESEGSFESDIDINENSIDLDWTIILNAETKTPNAQHEKYQAEFEHNHCENFDQLHTSVETRHGHKAVNSPLMRKAIGLPKKLRNKSNNKPKNPHVLEKKLATVTCYRCGAM
ncbi:hypothetical protein KIW84_020373 [Lathyrus oleraceus]|uniref:Uncharacterized protein n=1 Tax=Pisum sativum TaxID=3888 RepID=A0A9D5B7T0_PEA|nr:hypothetical protein KIW84_020373 [Pisum sativum]